MECMLTLTTTKNHFWQNQIINILIVKNKRIPSLPLIEKANFSLSMHLKNEVGLVY